MEIKSFFEIVKNSLFIIGFYGFFALSLSGFGVGMFSMLENFAKSTHTLSNIDECSGLSDLVNQNVSAEMTQYKVRDCFCSYAGNDSCGCFCQLYDLNNSLLMDSFGVRIWI